MTIKSDFNSVMKELSPILAGFKLALIVISYFGFGSVAKWVISHWYPFTRWIWDQFCSFFTLPSFPDVVKDSLTALVFFIPLGTTAVYGYINRDKVENLSTHRLLGAFFGFSFLFIICKDTLSAISKAITVEYNRFGDTTILIEVLKKISSVVDRIPLWLFVSSAVVYFILTVAIGFTIYKDNKRRGEFERLVRYSAKRVFGMSAIFGCVSGLFALGLHTSGIILGAEVAIIASIAIMFLILTILTAAIMFSPKKLYMAAGVCIAFILAALCFEMFVAVVGFIEKAPGANQV